jgi:propanol-preferring alcohol dehydrogenase
MRAMQIIEWGKPLQLRDYPTPEATGEQVLVRVESAGVCHSDVHIWELLELGQAGKVPPIPIETRSAERATESLADLKTGGKVRGRVVMTH